MLSFCYCKLQAGIGMKWWNLNYIPLLKYQRICVLIDVIAFNCPHSRSCFQNWWKLDSFYYGPASRYVKLRVAHAPGMPGTFSQPLRASDPDMHHDTCVTHVPWCMPGSLTSSFLWSRWRENVPGIPGACATSNFAYLVRGLWLPPFP